MTLISGTEILDLVSQVRHSHGIIVDDDDDVVVFQVSCSHCVNSSHMEEVAHNNPRPQHPTTFPLKTRVGPKKDSPILF